MAKPTRTINRLHFSDLDPIRFEDLCLQLVSRAAEWSELNHFGRKGSDSGIDIMAIKEEAGKIVRCAVQCKRYASIKQSDLKKIVDDLCSNLPLPDKILTIISCDLTKANYDFYKKYASSKGILDAEIWPASTLENKLYRDNKDLLFVYFGVKLENDAKSNAAKIKHSLRMEKRVLKELIDHKFLKENRDQRKLLFQPWLKFVTQTVYIRSIDDTSYPSVEDGTGISPWFRTMFYDTYHNGIEVWLDAAMGTSVLLDKFGKWELVKDYHDNRKTDSRYKVVYVKAIGQIPYSSIVDFKVGGDEYSSEPHIFCSFNFANGPCEKIYYKSQGDYEKMVPDWKLEEKDQTKFGK